MCYNAKIIMGKEEGATSHFCQAYDQQVAKFDKRSSHEAITVLKNITFHYTGKLWTNTGLCKPVCMQYVHVPKTWIQSFRKVYVVLLIVFYHTVTGTFFLEIGAYWAQSASNLISRSACRVN